jgi:hypothetical protein
LEYSQIVSSCTYFIAITKPNIAFATKILAKLLQNPNLQHFNAICKCLNYLEATKHYALKLRTFYIKYPIFAIANNIAYTDNLIT